MEAIEAMRKVEKKPEQLTELLRLLEDDDEKTRDEAEAVLERLGREAAEVLPAIKELTRHRSYAVRRNAVQVCDALEGSKKAVPIQGAAPGPGN